MRQARRITIIAAAATCSLAAAGGAAGAGSGTQRGTSCAGATQFTVLFWPPGHGAVASQRKPAFRLPHAEVHVGTRQVAHMEVGGRGGPAALITDCPPAAGSARPPVVPAVRRTAARLTCRFPRAPRFVRRTDASRATVTATVPRSRTGLRITMQAGASSLAYDPATCRVSAPPR